MESKEGVKLAAPAAVEMVVAVVAVVGEEYCGVAGGGGGGGGGGERELTVRKTCLFFPGDGYAAYDHRSGELVFRVDSYGGRRGPSLSDHLVLMDPSGVPILTVRRKWLSLHHRWEGFMGERKDGQKPLFSVKRSSIFGRDHCSIDVELHEIGTTVVGNAGREYRVDGSFAQRSCRVVMHCCNQGDGQDGDHEVEEKLVAEIKRKVDACSHVVLSKDVFSLCIKPGFDAAFAMGIVLILDQISSNEDGGTNRDIDPAAIVPSDEDDHHSNKNIDPAAIVPSDEDDHHSNKNDMNQSWK